MSKTLSVAIMILMVATAAGAWAANKTVTDAAGRKIDVPESVQRVICSGPGALRLLVYLQAQEAVVAVDDIEKRRSQFDARPYGMSNPQLKSLPMFGQFRGYDNPELILALNPQPQLIFKTYPTMGHDPVELQQKTGIPVVILNYGDLGDNRQDLYQALRIMGQCMNKEKRAEEVIDFFESHINDLKKRVEGIPESSRPSCYVGGIAFKGPHGFQSTEPAYPPFGFVQARNVAFDPATQVKALRHSNVSKEKIVEWDPDFLFLDLSSLQMGDEAGALYELKTDPAYQNLTAVKKGNVYGLLPYNWYAQNFGSILANGYFLGKLLYPERFRDIDPQAKADEIYTFLVGKPVFGQMDSMFHGMVFKRIECD